MTFSKNQLLNYICIIRVKTREKMKTQRKLILILVLIITANAFSQRDSSNRGREKARKVTNKVGKTTKKVDDANKTFNSATDSIANTGENTKRTVKKLKEAIFGSKKNKTKTKNNGELIIIEIPNVAYGDMSVNELVSNINSLKGMKKVSKSYANGNITITINYKESADSLWMLINENSQKMFIVKEMSEKKILLQLEKQNTAKK